MTLEYPISLISDVIDSEEALVEMYYDYQQRSIVDPFFDEHDAMNLRSLTSYMIRLGHITEETI